MAILIDSKCYYVLTQLRYNFNVKFFLEKREIKNKGVNLFDTRTVFSVIAFQMKCKTIIFVITVNIFI